MSNQEPPPPPTDFGGTPPPPPYGGQAPPPPSYAQAPPPPPPGYGQMPPAAYIGQPGVPVEKPPRPEVKLGGLLIIVGSIISIIGVFLPWVTVGGDSQDGTGVFLNSDFDLYDSPGSTGLVFAAITAGLGLALYFAGRVLAVAIVSIVVAALALLIGLGMVAIAADTADFGEGSLGFGAILQPIAPMITLAGAIVATSTRRRWPTA